MQQCPHVYLDIVPTMLHTRLAKQPMTHGLMRIQLIQQRIGILRATNQSSEDILQTTLS
jgi:hypothetical protein